MPFSNQTNEMQLNAAQVAIDNALADSEILPLLSEYGYSTERLAQGRALFEQAEELCQKQRKEYGDQFAASDDLQSAWEKADKLYTRYVKVARVALNSSRADFQKLGLSGPRKRTISGWLLQAKQFYTNTLNDTTILEQLAAFGITAEKLEHGNKLVKTVEAANANQEKEKGEAQASTKKRDEAMDRLDDWMSDFVAIAKIALEDHPQLIERLGILERS